MVSRDQCNAGGSHSFDTKRDNGVGTGEIIDVLACSKCSEVFERRTYQTIEKYVFQLCYADTCDGSGGDHNWKFDCNEYHDATIFVKSNCTHCNGIRHEEFRHYINEWIDANGNTL